MKLKQKLLYMLLFVLLFTTIYTFPVQAIEEPATYSPVCLLVDAISGKILYEKNAKEIRYPASTTKIMTAILALEHCDLSEEATVSYYAATSLPSGYSTASLQVGEEFTIEQLLYALLLPSANDAAIVIAEHISGSVEKFCDLMNAKAKELGCLNTNFVNPNGVHDENHYSTAYDLALISRYAMKNDTFCQMARTTFYALPVTDKYDKDDRKFVNTNDLIRSILKDEPDSYYYPYATGLKTGFTSAAMNCIVASAEKDGISLIAVILGAGQTEDGRSQRYLDCISLFDYGFASYTSKKLNEENEVLEQIKIPGATFETQNVNVLVQDEISVLIMDDDFKEITPTITIQEDLRAPIVKGTIVGKISYEIDGTEYSSNLILEKNVEKSSLPIILFRTALIILILFLIGFLLKSIDRDELRYKPK